MNMTSTDARLMNDDSAVSCTHRDQDRIRTGSAGFAHSQADTLSMRQARDPRAATVVRSEGLAILVRITDSPVDSIERRHPCCKGWMWKEEERDDDSLGCKGRGKNQKPGGEGKN
jgi:hypothetical protein